MTDLHVLIVKVAMVAGAVALATTFPAHACKVVGYANGEPLCATTSDTGRESYTDGRYQRSPGYWRWQRAQRAQNFP